MPCLFPAPSLTATPVQPERPRPCCLSTRLPTGKIPYWGNRLPKTFLGRKERLPAFHSSAASPSSCGREKRRPETRFLLHGKAEAARRSPLPDGSEDADPPLLFLCRITVFPVRQALHGEGKAPSSCGRKVPGLSDAKRAARKSGPPLFLARAADGPVPDASADTKALNEERLLKRSLSKDNLGIGLLSHVKMRSIMGDEALNFRVRNGIGCTRFSMDTKEIEKNKPHGLLVSVS